MAHDAAKLLTVAIHDLTNEGGRMIGVVSVICDLVTHPGLFDELDVQGVWPVCRKEFPFETDESHAHISTVVRVAIEIQVDQVDGVPECGRRFILEFQGKTFLVGAGGQFVHDF